MQILQVDADYSTGTSVLYASYTSKGEKAVLNKNILKDTLGCRASF